MAERLVALTFAEECRLPDEQRELLAWFVGLMVQKLQRNAHKGPWGVSDARDLFMDLIGEAGELAAELPIMLAGGRNGQDLALECADVANMGLLIAIQARATIPDQQPDPAHVTLMDEG